MARRKTVRNNPGRKGKAVRKRHHAFSGDRNRASPASIIKLYSNLTQEKRDAIVSMGLGSFLDIKCKQLHNPLITWFVQCYEPARRAFVVPCRGAIPLTEESVHIMNGLPRGQLEVKYYADYELESVIAARLFPGGSIRPKVSDLARMVEQYEGADDSFKELWMLFIMSTVVAPTTDNKMSNKCYPILVDIARANELNLCKFVAAELYDHLSNQKYTKGCLLYCMLRYFDALQTDHFELELGNAKFAINAWSKLAIDAVGALDVQEYDTTTFGSLELKDEYKEVVALEMGFFGGLDGFDSWMKLNTHPSCTQKQRVKASPLMQNFASSLNGLLSSLVQGLTQCSDGESSDVDTELSECDAHQNDASRNVAAPPKVGCATGHAKKKFVSPVVGRRNEGRQDGITSPAKLSPVVETHKKLQEDTISSASPPAMHSQINVPSFSDLDGSDEVNGGGNETDSPLESTPQDDDIIRGSAAHLAASLSNCKRTKESSVPSSSETIANNRIKNVVAQELGIPVRVSEQGSDSTAMIKSVPDHGQQVLETIPERDIIDDHLNATSGNVELKGKDVIIEESTNSGNLVDAHVPLVVSNETPKKRCGHARARYQRSTQGHGCRSLGGRSSKLLLLGGIRVAGVNVFVLGT